MTQQDLASALHISQPTYNRYELGQREPDQETMTRIADYFHVTLDFLLRHERPYERQARVPELDDFIKSGSYKIFGHVPSQRERKRLAAVIAAMYDNGNGSDDATDE